MKPSGGSTSSIFAGTSTPRFLPTVASSLTQGAATEAFDQIAITTLAE